VGLIFKLGVIASIVVAITWAVFWRQSGDDRDAMSLNGISLGMSETEIAGRYSDCRFVPEDSRRRIVIPKGFDAWRPIFLGYHCSFREQDAAFKVYVSADARRVYRMDVTLPCCEPADAPTVVAYVRDTLRLPASVSLRPQGLGPVSVFDFGCQLGRGNDCVLADSRNGWLVVTIRDSRVSVSEFETWYEKYRAVAKP